ncbi:MAG: alpha/beta fold hydrolase [Myxococcota bacterium]
MPHLDVPGASIYYEVHGAGPWLIFAHGAGGNHLSWWGQIPAFSGRFRCLTYAQRGWGRSSCEAEPDPTRFADDLEALLDHVGADRAALVGQSMGGWTVYGCALKQPERISHLVLTSTLAGLTDDAMIMRLLELHDPEGPFDGSLALAESFLTENPEMTFLMAEVAGLNPELSPAFLQALIALRYPPEPARLGMPILHLAGGRDRLFPLEIQKAARAKLPQSKLVVVEDAGHSIYWERPGVFNQVLADFLKQ